MLGREDFSDRERLPLATDNTGGKFNALEGSGSGLGPEERWYRCNMISTFRLHRAGLCIAIQRFPEAHRSSAAHDFRLTRIFRVRSPRS